MTIYLGCGRRECKKRDLKEERMSAQIEACSNLQPSVAIQKLIFF